MNLFLEWLLQVKQENCLDVFLRKLCLILQKKYNVLQDKKAYMNLKVYFYERKKYDLTREVTLFQFCQAGAGGAEIIFCSQFVGY